MLVLFFSLIFILKLKLVEPFRNEEILIISLFFQKMRFWVLGVIQFFLQFLVDIGPGSVDPHIFADPDPGSQNHPDPEYLLIDQS